MNLTALLAASLALQTAGQTPTPPIPKTQTPPAATTPAPKVPVNIPDKYVAPAPAGGAIVAKVDGQPIYAHDVENLMWESLGHQAVDELSTLVIVRQAATKQGITVSAADVEKELRALLTKFDTQTASNPQSGRPKGMSVEEFLANQGYPLSRLYLNTEIQVTLDKISEKTFDPKHYVKVSLLLFKAADATPAAVTAAKAKADAAYKQLKAGGKWEAAVKTSDLPPQYVNVNGLLGWLDEASFPPDIVAKVKDLQPGQISQVIKVDAAPSQGGVTSFQIFRVEQLGAKAVGADLDEFKQHYLENQRKTLLEQLKQGAKVEFFPTKEPAEAAKETTPPVKTTGK